MIVMASNPDAATAFSVAGIACLYAAVNLVLGWFLTGHQARKAKRPRARH